MPPFPHFNALCMVLWLSERPQNIIPGISVLKEHFYVLSDQMSKERNEIKDDSVALHF